MPNAGEILMRNKAKGLDHLFQDGYKIKYATIWISPQDIL